MKTKLEKLQLEFATRSLQAVEDSQRRVLDLQEKEATWGMIKAWNEAERTKEEKLASARTHKRLEAQAASILRPCNQMRPDIQQDGDEWVATLGDVIGRGPTPETACQQFDRIWLGKDEV
jgi:hypothetical protein